MSRDLIGAHMQRVCDAFYICLQCGATSQGSNIRVLERAWKTDWGNQLPQFQCDCGGWMEPLEFVQVESEGERKS